jgi:hypothetical protein
MLFESAKTHLSFYNASPAGNFSSQLLSATSVPHQHGQFQFGQNIEIECQIALGASAAHHKGGNFYLWKRANLSCRSHRLGAAYA